MTLRINPKGMTLTEIMVSTVIFTFILAGLYTTLTAGNVAWQTYEAAVAAQRDLRNVIGVMSRDFRVADNIIVTPVADGMVVAFNHPDDGAVNYSWATSGSDANRIIRQTAARSRIIANHISAFNLVDGPDDVTVSLTSTVAAVQGADNQLSLSAKMAKR